MRLITHRGSMVALPLALILASGCTSSSSNSTDGASTTPQAETTASAVDQEVPANDPAAENVNMPLESVDSGTPIEFFGAIGVTQIRRENHLFDGQPLIESRVNGGAVLIRNPEPYTFEAFRQSVVDIEDACTRYEQGIPVEGQLAGIEVIPPEALDGGAVLTINSPQGSYMALTRMQSAGGPGYTGEDLPLPVPASLVADIPGADFPAVSNIAIPDIDPLIVLGDTPETVLSPTFTWVAGPVDANAVARVVVSAGSASTDGTIHSFICTAIDDGEFTAPDWATAQLDAGAEVKTRTMLRSADQYTIESSALVVGSNYSSYISQVSSGL